MKSADVKPATTSKSGPGKPFFSGKGGAVQDQENRPAFFNHTVQAKLTVGEPGDKHERQADQAADKVVMRMGETRAPEKRGIAPSEKKNAGTGGLMTPAAEGGPMKAKAPPVQMKCAQCEMKERQMKKEEEETPRQQKVQRKPIFDSNAEPPPADDQHKIRRCAACEGKEMARRSGGSGGSGTPTSPDLEARLQSTKGGGQPIPDGTRQQMESSMGADFSGVRVHEDSGAAQMNKDLNARAFTHGNDIYFNSGQYKPEDKQGQHLLAHELTHTVQQGAAPVKQGKATMQQEAAPGAQKQAEAPTVQRGVLDSLEDAADWVGGEVSDAAGAVADGAEELADDAVDAAKAVGGEIADIAGDIKDGVVGAASWVKDRIEDIGEIIEEGAEAVWEFIKGLVDKVVGALKDAWESLKKEIQDKLGWLGNAFNSLVDMFTHPLRAIANALENMNPTLIEIGWKGFVSFVSLMWDGFKTSGQAMLAVLNKIWDGVDGMARSTLDLLDGAVDSKLFSVLPDWVQKKAHDAIDGLRSLWSKVDGEARGWLSTINGAAEAFFAAGDEFVQKLNDVPIEKVVDMVHKFGAFINKVLDIIDDPMQLIEPIAVWMAGELKAAPTKFLGVLQEQIDKNQAKRKQKNHGKMPKRYMLDDNDITLGVLKACTQKWMQMELVSMLKDMILTMIWPPATWKAIKDAWGTAKKDISDTWNRLYEVKSLHDLWTNLLNLTDILVILWRFLNTVAGLLYIYLAIALIIGGAIIGGVFGGGVGAIPGAMAGAELAGAIGEFLLVSFLLAEASNLSVQYLLLSTGLNTPSDQEKSFNKISDSVIGLVTAGILALLAAIAAKIAGGIMDAAKSIFSKLSDLLKDTGDSVKGKPGEGKGGGPEEKGGPKDERNNAKDESSSEEQLNKDEKGERRLKRPLESSDDGEVKMAIDEDGACEICASPCEKMEKKYGSIMDDETRSRIEDIQNEDIPNADKIAKMKEIEKELRSKLTHMDEKGNLKPDQKYKMAGEHGYNAETDSLGRLKNVSADDLKLSKYDRAAHEPDTPGKVKGDHAGHMIGDRFGGSPELDNLVSQTSKNNLSTFKVMENKWASALKEVPPQKVRVEIEIKYDGDGGRPSGFDVLYQIGDEDPVFQHLDN
jgi:hypothetical protein